MKLYPKYLYKYCKYLSQWRKDYPGFGKCDNVTVTFVEGHVINEDIVLDVSFKQWLSLYWVPIVNLLLQVILHFQYTFSQQICNIKKG